MVVTSTAATSSKGWPGTRKARIPARRSAADTISALADRSMSSSSATLVVDPPGDHVLSDLFDPLRPPASAPVVTGARLASSLTSDLVEDLVGGLAQMKGCQRSFQPLMCVRILIMRSRMKAKPSLGRGGLWKIGELAQITRQVIPADRHRAQETGSAQQDGAVVRRDPPTQIDADILLPLGVAADPADLSLVACEGAGGCRSGPGTPHQLVLRGPYAVSRNPIQFPESSSDGQSWLLGGHVFRGYLICDPYRPMP